MVGPEKREAMQRRMAALGIREEDLLEKFIRGAGSGGQKINKTSSCVYLKHLPTGVEVKCQAERSRAMNRFIARRELCEQLEEAQLGEKSARQQAIEKIRRQKRRRSRRQRQRDVEKKRRHGEKKAQRRPPGTSD
ncbi:MAG: peptide chain release factor-like protein [Akkermansiaceae bacterium]|nr:peptide chain release factor-like protein [Akkermansiaceae bacterium]NNM29261.1 peptide chain release factor-like protein [Akkermansiaceae bacterium]